jgi:hypothetical protein
MAGRIAYYGNIVRDGLVLDLDAAKRDSYPGSGTSWRDIAGGVITGSLVNGPTFDSANGGSIVFDAGDDYYSISNNTSLDCTNAVSVFAWVKTPSSARSKEILMKYNNVTVGIPYGFQWWVDGNIYVHITTSVGWKEITGLIGYSLNTWYNIGLTYDQTTLRAYINGSQTTTSSQTGTINTNSFPIICSSGLGGSISTIQLYNRALSAAEITQNYNALKGRYGL